MLEVVKKTDAVLLCAMKDKKLTEAYPKITRKVVNEAYPDLLEPLPEKPAKGKKK